MTDLQKLKETLAGLDPATAGSKFPPAETLGRSGLPTEAEQKAEALMAIIRSEENKGPEAEDKGTTRPGSSLFSPHAPFQQLEGRRAALTDDEKRLVEAFKQLQAAKAAVYAPTAKYFELNYAAERALHEAACTLAQSLLVRAEGGLNHK